MEYGCALIISALSSTFLFARTSTIQDVLVCPQTYFLAISESGNIRLNKMVTCHKWYIVFNSEVREKDFCIIDANIRFSYKKNLVPFSYREVLPDITFSTVLNIDFSETNCAKCVINSLSQFVNNQPLYVVLNIGFRAVIMGIFRSQPAATTVSSAYNPI